MGPPASNPCAPMKFNPFSSVTNIRRYPGFGGRHRQRSASGWQALFRDLQAKHEPSVVMSASVPATIRHRLFTTLMVFLTFRISAATTIFSRRDFRSIGGQPDALCRQQPDPPQFHAANLLLRLSDHDRDRHRVARRTAREVNISERTGCVPGKKRCVCLPGCPCLTIGLWTEVCALLGEFTPTLPGSL
jgi:hypothetical protein